MQWSDTVGNTGILQEILDSLEQPLTDPRSLLVHCGARR